MDLLSFWKRSRISLQLHVFGAAIALPLIIASGILIYLRVVEWQDNAVRQLATQAEVTRTETERFIRRTTLLLSKLAERPDIIKSTQGGQCSPAFNGFLDENPQYANLVVSDANGRRLCSALPLSGQTVNGQKNSSALNYLLEAVKRERATVMGRLQQGPVSQLWIVPMAYPLHDEANRYVGMIGVALNLSNLRPLTGPVGLMENVDVALVDGSDTVLTHTEHHTLKSGSRFDSGLMQVLRQSRQSVAPLADSAPGHPHYFYAAAPVAGTDWYAVASANAEPVLAQMRHDYLAYNFLLLGVLGIWVVLARLIGRGIGVPLLTLAERASRIAKGEREIPPALEGSQEIAAADVELRHMLQVLMAAERRLLQFYAVVEQSPVGIIITDKKGDIEYVNPRFCEASGYTQTEVLGRNTRMLKGDGIPSEEYQRLWHSISSGKEWSGELRNRKKDGSFNWDLMRIIPICSDHGDIVNYMALKEDITTRKQLEEREHAETDRVQRQSQLTSLGEMAATIAHEINQPLMAIVAYGGVAERLLTQEQPNLNSLRTAVRGMKDDALRAGNIINGVRSLINRQAVRREDINVNTLVMSAVQLLRRTATAAGVAIELELASDLPLVQADGTQIEQVLLNLMRNGIEAMEGMTDSPRLHVCTRRAEVDEQVQISVRDYGCGLPSDVASEIFMPFFTTKSTGVGLGLSISQSIVEAHGGHMWALANADAGTTFHFTLRSQQTAA